MKRVFLIILFFLTVNSIFFSPLFFPVTRMFITPEFRGGDIANMHYPYKFFQQKKILEGKIPFWSKNTSGGFPIFAQSEMGFFNPIYYLTLRFLPFFVAVNVQIILIFTFIMCSTYFLCRKFRASTQGSIVGGLIFGYSFFNILNILHLPHLMGIAFLPLVFGLVLRLVERQTFVLFTFLTLSICFFLFSGHFQYFSFTFILIFSYLTICLFYKKIKLNIYVRVCIIIVLGLGLGIALAAVQLVPTGEFILHSSRVSNTFSIFGKPLNFSPVDFLTILHPFIFGNPRLGSFDYTSHIPPWDGTLFIGFIPLLLIFIKILKKETWRKSVYWKIFTVLLILFALLAWEEKSPIYFLFAIPPFSLFRLNSRYILVDILFLSILATSGYEMIQKKLKKRLRTIFFLTLFIIIFIERFIGTYSYHNLLETQKYFQKPKTYELLKNSSRLYSDNVHTSGNEIFAKKGFDKNQEFYLNILKNTMSPDINLIYSIPSFNNSISGVNTGRFQIYLNEFGDVMTRIDDSGKNTDQPFWNDNFFTIGAIDKVISTKKIESKKLKVIVKIQGKDNITYYLYDVLNPKKRISFVTKFITVHTLTEFTSAFGKMDLADTAVLEGDFDKDQLITNQSLNTLEVSKFKYNVLKDLDEEIVFTTDAPFNGVMTLADTYYPGWKAFLDNKEVPIYHADFLYRGIYLPQGRHTVQFVYEPQSFYLGTMISVSAIMAFIVVTLAWLIKTRYYKFERL